MIIFYRFRVEPFVLVDLILNISILSKAFKCKIIGVLNVIYRACVMLMIADYTDDNDKRVISDFKVVDKTLERYFWENKSN